VKLHTYSHTYVHKCVCTPEPIHGDKRRQGDATSALLQVLLGCTS